MVINFNNIGGEGGGGSYVLPVASDSTLGGVKVGSGLTIDSNGVLSASGETGGGYSIYSTQEIQDMTVSERQALLIELTNKVMSGETIYVSGVTKQYHNQVILPLVAVQSSTTVNIRWISFGGIIKNGYYSFVLNSNGETSGEGYYNTGSDAGQFWTSVREFYTLPTAGSYTKGGIKVGSGLSIASEKLSVSIGNGLAYSGNTVVVSNPTYNLANIADMTENEKKSTYSAITADYSAGKNVYLSARDRAGNTISMPLIQKTASSATFGYAAADKGYSITLTNNGVLSGTDTALYYDRAAIIPLTGGTGGGPAVYVLNHMSQAERLALYNELVQYRQGYIGVSSGFPEDQYIFVLANGNGEVEQDTDAFAGNIIMRIDAIHPDDYGGGIIFTGTYEKRNSEWNCMKVRCALNYEGSLEDVAVYSGDYPDLRNDLIVKIDSSGNLYPEDSEQALGALSSLVQFHRIYFHCEGSDNAYATAPMTVFYRQHETGHNELVEHIGCTINLFGTTYKGEWSFEEWGWGSNPIAANTWTNA